jgi:hypothetical protein
MLIGGYIMKKSCQNCGYENAEKDKFCRKCGTKIEDIKQPIKKTEEPEIIETKEPIKPEPKHKPKKTKTPKIKSDMESKMVLGIALVALIISIAAISSAFLVSPSSLSASVVDTTALANDSVTSQKVVDGSISDSDIDPLGISRIKADSITGDQIVDNSISLSDLTSSLSEKISGTINIANDSITSEKIKDGTITAIDLASNSITSAKIPDEEIKASDIATNAITSAEIANGAVDTSELANGAVTYDKMDIKIRYGHENNVVHGQTILHNMGATPTSVTVTPRYNSSLDLGDIIIANVYDVTSSSFKVALSICSVDIGGAVIEEVDGNPWGAEDIDWVAIRVL